MIHRFLRAIRIARVFLAVLGARNLGLGLLTVLGVISLEMGLPMAAYGWDLQMGAPILAAGSSVRPGKTAYVQVLVTNPDPSEVDGFLVLQLEGYSLQNYSHAFHIGSQQEKRLTLPVLIPSQAKLGSKIEAKVLLERLENGERVKVVQAGERVFQTMPLSVEPDRNVTLGLFGKARTDALSWEWRKDPRNYLYEATIAARILNGMTRRMLNIHDEPLPLDASLWDSIDTTILADDRYLEDPAQVAALQSWVQRGGRLWIMLDRVKSPHVSSLLGPQVHLQEVDSIELPTVSIRTNEPVTVGEEDLRYSVQPPVEMRRMRMYGVEVTHWVDEWPGVAWVRLGEGEICLTTLEVRAWLKPTAATMTKEEFDRLNQEAEASGAVVTERRAFVSRNPDRSSDFELRPWVGTMPQRVFYESVPSTTDGMIEAAVADQIGLPVINKAWVFGVLLGFLGLLVVTLWGLGRWKRLESIGWIAPLMAMLLALPLLVGASLTRRELKSQFSVLQRVNTSAGLGRASVDEAVAIYQSSSGGLRLRGTMGGDVVPSQSVWSRVPMSIETKDFGEWEWNVDQWPAGIWSFRQRLEMLQANRSLLGKVTAEGLELRWQDEAADRSLSRFEDMLIYWPPSTPIIGQSQGAGRWLATAQDGVDGASWVQGTLLNEKQLMHQKFYAGLLGRADPPVAHAPTVYGWSELLGTSLESEPAVPKSGEALWSVPLKIESANKGERMSIPGWMLTVRPAQLSSSFFDSKHGMWAKKTFSNAAVVDLRFMLPTELIPSQVDEVTLVMRLLMPQRTLRVSLLEGGVAKSLAVVESPTSQIRMDLTQPEVQRALLQGWLDLRFAISDREGSGDSSGRSGTWQVDNMRLDIQATK